MSAMDSASTAVGATTTTVKRLAKKLGNFVNQLTLQQSLMIAAGTVLVLSIFSSLLVSFWQKYLPSMLITLIKFLIYLVIPLVAAGGTFFGMYLEKQYKKFDDATDFILAKAEMVASFFRNIKNKFKKA